MSTVTASTAFSSRVGTPARRSMKRCDAVVPPRAASDASDATTTATSTPPPPTTTTLPRRAALSLACALAMPSAVNVMSSSSSPSSSPFAARAADAEPMGTKDFDFKTYKLTVPGVYEEVNVPLGANGVVSPTVMLLRDSRPGQAGNTISLSKQIIPEGGISSVKDIGNAEEAAKRLVSAESARSKGVGGIGGAGAVFRDASERVGPGGLTYYAAEYSKNVSSVGRVILTTLVVADGVLYTLTCEEDAGRFESEMGDALRKASASLVVTSTTPAPAPAPEPVVEKKTKSRFGRK